MSLLVRTCSTERMNVARLAARVALILGGFLWVAMAAAQTTVQKYADLTYSFNEVVNAGVSALLPAAIALGVFVLAIFYERLAAVVLLVAGGGVLAWGLIAGWETLVWVSVMVVMVLPLVISAVLLLLAAATQRVCELEEGTAQA